MIDLLIATLNKNKAREIGEILALPFLTVHNLTEYSGVQEVEETGQNFLENALLKARAYAQTYGLLTLADDSGLAVDALNGAPGIYSARYAGPGAKDHLLYEKLLKEMLGVAPEKRTARFHCAMALVSPEGWERTVEGTVEGTIATSPAGENGFGYDPVFFYPPFQRTFAQISAAEKNEISHRAKALRLVHDILLSLNA
jgi:XTP/dITP diphosphohydrolase